MTFNDGSTITYTLDAGNRLIGISDSLGGTISRGYDGLDNLLSETTPQGSVAYTYDADAQHGQTTRLRAGRTPPSRLTSAVFLKSGFD